MLYPPTLELLRRNQRSPMTVIIRNSEFNPQKPGQKARWTQHQNQSLKPPPLSLP